MRHPYIEKMARVHIHTICTRSTYTHAHVYTDNRSIIPDHNAASSKILRTLICSKLLVFFQGTSFAVFVHIIVALIIFNSIQNNIKKDERKRKHTHFILYFKHTPFASLNFCEIRKRSHNYFLDKFIVHIQHLHTYTRSHIITHEHNTHTHIHLHIQDIRIRT